MRNPLTKIAFTDFCASKPADEEYEYWSNECAFGQFLSACGFEANCIGVKQWHSEKTGWQKLPRGFNAAVEAKPRTFGDLAQRLRA